MRFKTIIAAISVVFTASAFADAAIVVKLDEGCSWEVFHTSFYEGNVHFVLNDGNQWVLSCHGELVEGDSLRRAVVWTSSDDDPLDLCTTPFGATYNWRKVATPSGKSHLTCWGTVEE